MAWLQFLDPKVKTANSYKVTADQDLEECSGWNCSSLDYCRGNTRLARVTVKKFKKSYDPVFYPIYVYLKSFKWDSAQQSYTKNAQVPLSLHEFKMFRENLGTIDDMIDRIIMADGTPTIPLVFRPQSLLRPVEREDTATAVADIHHHHHHHNDTEMSSSAEADADSNPVPHQDL